MKLLKDDELLPLIQQNDPIIENIEEPVDWYSATSTIGPSSINLHIGAILLPDTPDGEQGSNTNPKTRHALKKGEIAVVVSREKINFPPNISAFGFPPVELSSFGCFMTNAGHVDPGYKGPLRFTIINLGREPFLLTDDDIIFTLLIIQLSGDVTKGWCERNGGEGKPPSKDDLLKLPVDFLDIDARAEAKAEEISTKLIKEKELELKSIEGKWKIYGAVATTIIAIVITLLQLVLFNPTKKSVSELEKRVMNLTTEVKNYSVTERLNDQLEGLDKRVNAIEKNF